MAVESCRKNLLSFVKITYLLLYAGKKLSNDPYLAYLCRVAEDFAAGVTRQLVVNLPPRHGKTFIFSICLAAWILGRDPAQKIMVITHTEELSTNITSTVRKVLQLAWFRKLFPKTQIDRRKVTNLTTTAGGSLQAFSISGHITGHGADVIIIDDPVDLKDADNQRHHEWVRRRYDEHIASRRDDPSKARMLIVLHRHHPDDLAGHVLEHGGFQHVILEFIATRSQTYDLEHGLWHRMEGDLLRPDAYPPEEVKRIRALPNFPTLYQQDTTGGLGGKISPAHFGQVALEGSPKLPTVITIDPGQSGGSNNSYSVIQVWCWDGRRHLLVHQWREQCSYAKLRVQIRYIVRLYRPCHVLVEATGQGPALLSDLKPTAQMHVHRVTPDGRSKVTRLAGHLELIRAGGIALAAHASWLVDFIAEVVAFPRSPYSDQVDAMTQYLDFMAQEPKLWAPTPRAVGSIGGSAMVQSQFGARVTQNSMGCLVRYRRGAR
jgi:predicted phage terminase large subunit-like protein